MSAKSDCLGAKYPDQLSAKTIAIIKKTRFSVRCDAVKMCPVLWLKGLANGIGAI